MCQAMVSETTCITVMNKFKDLVIEVVQKICCSSQQYLIRLVDQVEARHVHGFHLSLFEVLFQCVRESF